MTTNTALSPVSLSYTAALRGVKPRRPGDPFVYVDTQCSDTNYFVCLAASNPEGQFYGLVSSTADCQAANTLASSRHISNVKFLDETVSSLLAKVIAGTSPVASTHYLIADETDVPLSEQERNATYDLAKALLTKEGIFSTTYRPYAKEDGALRFLVREFVPEMDPVQCTTFLRELKSMGGFYFAANPKVAAALNQAIAKGTPDEFFSAFDQGDASSRSFDTIVALRQRGFSYAGDSVIAANYVELSIPSEAQALVLSCKDNHLYEPIKDFALNRQVRADLWCKQPVETCSSFSELFAGFAYGITVPQDVISKEVKVQGKIVELNAPVYNKLIELMSLMPVTIGDFLAHPTGQGFQPTDIIGAIQILIALGYAKPMRGMSRNDNMSDVKQPRLVGQYNQYLSSSTVASPEIRLASTIVGAPVTLSARDALVMQALDRVGLANSVGALLPELERLAMNPALASRVMDTANPTSEVALQMVQETVTKSIVQWYAYGLLKAA